MRAIITGGTGFVGRHLSRHLEKNGIAVTSLSSNVSESDEDIRDFRLLDIREDGVLQTLFGEVQPEQIYHLAAITSISAATQDERTAFDVNVWGTRNVLSGAASLGKKIRVLYVSTSQVYGNCVSLPITEENTISPQNSYAATKAMGEILCGQYASKVESLIVRPFNHSGPGQRADFVLSYIAQQIAEIEAGRMNPVIRLGNLNVRRDFTDARDVVRAYQLLMEKGVAGQVYNVCSGQAFLVSEALDVLLSLTDVKINVQTEAAKVRKDDANSIFGSSAKLRRDTGWEPLIGFETMLNDILHYWRGIAFSPLAAHATK
jgi:GDP-4-dehydro-6-deoxy-D-mannose reductase